MADDQADPLERIKSLREFIAHHDRLYFDRAEQQISDERYDASYNELLELERRYPQHRDANSPTMRVGGSAEPNFAPVAHEVPMLSLEKAHAAADIDRFWARVAGSAGAKVKCVAMPKLDGLAIALRFTDGRLAVGATRGDGVTGEDITANLRMLRGIPQQLELAGELEVRGEAFMSRAAFIETNAKQRAGEHKEFVNPRNAAAGTLRQLNPLLVRARRLDFRAYWAQRGTRQLEPALADTLARLSGLGFAVVEPWELVDSRAQFEGFVAKVLAMRDELECETDGVVLRVDNADLAAKLGATAKSPRAAIAFKFQGMRGQTELLDVAFQLGRSGVVTPVARLSPVQVGGVTISSATLHNCQMLEQLELRVGDMLELERAGDVIPKILGVVSRTSRADARRIELPAYCPSCGGKLARSSVNLQCANGACRGVLLQRLEHFVSRNALDIEGFGAKRLEQLVEAQMVSRPAHLFALSEQQLGSFGKDAKQLASNLVAALERARNTALDRLLFALGIPGLGYSGAKALAEAFGSAARIARASAPALCFFKPVQFGVAQQISEYLRGAGGEELRRLRVNKVAWDEADSPAPKVVPVARLLEHVAYLGDEDFQAGMPQVPPVLASRLHSAGMMPDTLDELAALAVEDLERTGMSKSNAQRCCDQLGALLANKVFTGMVGELQTLAGVSWGCAGEAQGRLAGLLVVVTGTLEGYDRKQAWALVEAAGGKIVQSVTAKTNLVVAGARPGAQKIAQAGKLGVKIIDPQELFELLRKP